jgi:hydrogenase/urease accessory protein HupE
LERQFLRQIMRPWRMQPRAVSLAIVGTLLGLAPAAWAHDETVSASEVEISDGQVLWKVDVGIAGLAKAIELPGAEPELDEGDIQAVKPQIARYLGQGLELELNGRKVVPQVGVLEPRYEPFVATGQPYLARVSLELRFVAAAPIQIVRANVGFFSDLTSQHRAVVKVRWDRESKQLTRLGPSQIVLERGRVNPTPWTAARDFVLWGAHHIFIGYDHIAFVLALLLAVRRFGELIKIITSFTIAHSITILLAAFDVVRIPGQITESLIAASIVYVAVENLVRRGEGGRWRWLLTFGFGLVHGLGFAEVLRERLAETPGGMVLPVLCFNLGVEVGQVAIVSLAFPVLIWLRRAADDGARAIRQRRIVQLGSLPILLLGVLWLGERLFP